MEKKRLSDLVVRNKGGSSSSAFTIDDYFKSQVV